MPENASPSRSPQNFRPARYVLSLVPMPRDSRATPRCETGGRVLPFRLKSARLAEARRPRGGEASSTRRHRKDENMATSSNVPNASMSGGVPFERGLSIEDAERLAAAFKPSWELDE